MLDAVAHSIDQGRGEEAKAILASALERHRATIRELRDLSFALEPVVLRDHGFRPALAGARRAGRDVAPAAHRPRRRRRGGPRRDGARRPLHDRPRAARAVDPPRAAEPDRGRHLAHGRRRRRGVRLRRRRAGAPAAVVRGDRGARDAAARADRRRARQAGRDARARDAAAVHGDSVGCAPMSDENGDGGGGYLLFVWSPDRLHAARAGRRAAADRARVRGRRPEARRDEDRAVAAPGRHASLRVLRRHEPDASRRGDRLGGDEPEHERLREARSRTRPSRRRRRRRPPRTGRRPPSRPRRSTRARSSIRSPPIVCVIAAATRTAALVPGGARERQLVERNAGSGGRVATTSATLPYRVGRRERVVVEQVVRTRARPPGRRLDEVRLRPRDVLARGRTPRRARRRCARSGRTAATPSTKSASPHSRVRHVAPVELVHPRRPSAAPRSSACASPSPVDHGLPRRRSGAAGQM